MEEINGRIAAEEAEFSAAQRKNQDLLLRLQGMEREGKQRLVGRKNDNLRLKEELAALEQNFNKMLVTLNTEEKEIEKKQHQLIKLELEVRDVTDKTSLIERKYSEEISNINISHQEDLRELSSKLAVASAEEQKLNEERAGVVIMMNNF